MRYFFMLAAAIILFSACQDEQPVKETPAKDSLVIPSAAPAEPAPEPETMPVQLKPYTLNEASLFTKGAMTKARTLSKEEYAALHIAQIDAVPAGFTYRLLDTLYNGPRYTIVLIARDNANENIAWLCSYERPGKLLQKQEVYYDNAEGFRSVSTVIKAKNITVTLYNDFAETEEGKKIVKQYTIGDDAMLVPGN